VTGAEDELDAVIDTSRWVDALADWRARFAAAEPFPHLVVDDALRPESFRRAVEGFPDPAGADWISYHHVNERKLGNVDPTSWGPELGRVARALTGEPFTELLRTVTGLDDLVADETFDGAGLHVTRSGGHLGIHRDFDVHHRRPDWRRRCNLLLYLNESWPPDAGGDLELWDAELTRCVRRIAPLGNRMVLFLTSDRSFHGHPTPLRTPPGTDRRSLAVYYYTPGHVGAPHPTRYRSVPGAGPGPVAVAVDNALLGLYDRLKRRLGTGDRVVSRLLGAADRLRRGSR